MEDSQKKKKIIFILPTLAAGGAERVIITLMNRINKERFDPFFVVLDEGGPLRHWIDDDIPFYSLNHKRVRNSYFPLLNLLKKLKPDVVMTTMAHVNFLALMLKPFFPNTKFIVREANVLNSSLKSYPFWKAELIKIGYKILYPRAHVVVSPAQCIVEEFNSLLNINTENHVVIYNPVDIEKIYRRIKFDGVNKKEKHNIIHFSCAGRLHYQKGFDRLIESLPEKLVKDYDWHLTIMGEGKERDRLLNIVRKRGLSHKITFTGLVKYPWATIAQSDCFLLPSRWEGMPNVVLEALACGTPVIGTSEAGGIAEIGRAANKNGEDVIKIASSMHDFISLMRQVRPFNKNEEKQSLLPRQFCLQEVTSSLESIL